MRPIAVFGGTFDPVHRGHLETASYLVETLDLDHVRFIVSVRPPHRRPPVASSAHRRRMLQLSLAGRRGLCEDDRETRRRGPSYTVWTLRSLRADWPARPLAWVVGADAFLEIPSWFHAEEILTLAHLIVLSRPGWELPAPGPVWCRHWITTDRSVLTHTTAGRVYLSAAPLIDVSASAVRDRIRTGPRDCPELPGVVWTYIKDNGLYGYPGGVTQSHAI